MVLDRSRFIYHSVSNSNAQVYKNHTGRACAKIRSPMAHNLYRTQAVRYSPLTEVQTEAAVIKRLFQLLILYLVKH